MSGHFLKELENLRRRLLNLVTMVEDHLDQAIEAVERRDPQFAADIIENDRAIDAAEVAIEEECLKIIALYQPVAGDLRFLVTALKVNNDLERIGDLSANIAKRSMYLPKPAESTVSFDFRKMVEHTRRMVRDSLTALMERNVEQARGVFAMDDEVDRIHREMYRWIKEAVREDPQRIDTLLNLLGISRAIERVADLATNIAEDVVFLVEGEIVRHEEGLS